ncbi:hypothetical protein BGZ98_002844, partial [Dissophora globulifera]
HSDWEVNLPTEDDIDMDEVGGNLRQTLFKIALSNLKQVQESFSKEGFDKFESIPFKDALYVDSRTLDYQQP